MDGLPPSALGLAAQQAAAAGHEGATAEAGPWLLTLDAPSYMPILTHARNRALREEFYRAYITRASDRAAVPGAGDNAVLIEKTLALRHEKAALLGFACYADLSMASKMATLTSARALLDRLASASREAAGRELEEVTAYAREHGFQGDALALWDVPFYAERLREARYDLTDEALRPYFALPAVLDGLFQLVHRLFGVTVEAADGAAPVWHPDVRFFNVLRDGERVASFYLDPYARAAEGKRGGAWMDEVVGRSTACAPTGQVREGREKGVGMSVSFIRGQWAAAAFDTVGVKNQPPGPPPPSSYPPLSPSACPSPTWSATSPRPSATSRR